MLFSTKRLHFHVIIWLIFQVILNEQVHFCISHAFLYEPVNFSIYYKWTISLYMNRLTLDKFT